MNGFIIFDRADAAADFLREPEIASLRPRGRFVQSSRDPLIIFRGLSSQELSTIHEVAKRLGGRVKGSTSYSPM